MIATGCSSTERLKSAAAEQGRISAGINLPAYPDDCRKKEPHAAIQVGDELRSVLVRERGALDKANARTVRCAAFYDDTVTAFGAPSK